MIVYDIDIFDKLKETMLNECILQSQKIENFRFYFQNDYPGWAHLKLIYLY